jgi:glutaredoxin 3
MAKTEVAMERRGLVIYSRAYCPYCWRAKRLLKRQGYPFEEVDVGGDEELSSRLVEATGRKTVPLIFLGGRLLGGFEELRALARSGDLKHLLGERT